MDIRIGNTYFLLGLASTAFDDKEKEIGEGPYGQAIALVRLAKGSIDGVIEQIRLDDALAKKTVTYGPYTDKFDPRTQRASGRNILVKRIPDTPYQATIVDVLGDSSYCAGYAVVNQNFHARMRVALVNENGEFFSVIGTSEPDLLVPIVAFHSSETIGRLGVALIDSSSEICSDVVFGLGAVNGVRDGFRIDYSVR